MKISLSSLEFMGSRVGTKIIFRLEKNKKKWRMRKSDWRIEPRVKMHLLGGSRFSGYLRKPGSAFRDHKCKILNC